MLEYASGTQREPVALLIATIWHSAQSACEQTRNLETIGGAFLEQLGPEAVAKDSFGRLLGRLDEPENRPRYSGLTRRRGTLPGCRSRSATPSAVP